MNTGTHIRYTTHVVSKIYKSKQIVYEEAVKLRRRGFTYTEIAKYCDVSRGTVSNWLSPLPFSRTVAQQNQKRAVTENTKRLTSINKARLTERKNQTIDILREAETSYKHYRQSPLFVAGLAIYLSVGDITHKRLIRLSNTQPELHKVFITFLIEYLGVEKSDIHFWLLLYPDHDEIACMKRWSKKIGLSPAQFYKNQRVAGRSVKKTLHFGVGNTIIGSTLLKQKLTHWIGLMTKDIQ